MRKTALEGLRWEDRRAWGRYDYTGELELDHLAGSVCSALPAQRLPPPDQRTAFADQIRRALAPHAPFTEPVPVRMLLGRRTRL